MKAKYLCVCILLIAGLAAIALPADTYAYNVPQDNSRAKYFYVFGPEGDPDLGAGAAHWMDLYVDVPKSYTGEVLIAIYDSDTGGFRDMKAINKDAWNTKTQFTVYGAGDKELGGQTVGEDPGLDRNYLQFGPYPASSGKEVGNSYRFKLAVKGLEGSDENLFYVKVSPDSADTFSYQTNIRLLDQEGDKMYFYPEVPANTADIIVENYDIDPDGGTAEVYVSAQNTRYAVNSSMSDKWSETKIPVNSTQQGRIDYVLIKGTQKYANAVIRVKDSSGNDLPIYFRGSNAPRIAVVREPMVKEEKKDVSPCNKFTFDATQSYDPNNEELTYAWDFGDGTTSDKPVVTHVYEKAGEYKVTLTVKDNSGMKCDTSSVSQVVKVNTPPIVDFIAPEKVCANTSVELDAGATKDDTPDALTYKWDLGDGTSAQGAAVSKTYKSGGKYRVKLFVDDGSGTVCSSGAKEKVIIVNSAPTVNAGSDIDKCLSMSQDYKVSFNADAKDPDGDALKYAWDFGDGNTASGKSVTHTYAKGGTYTAKVTVDDEAESSCSTATDALNITLNKKPVADAGPDQETCVNSVVEFNGSGSSGEGNLSYNWDFGDGNKAEGANVTNTYAKGGKYQVKLVVDDKKGTNCSVAEDTVIVIANTRPVAALAEVDKTSVDKQVVFDASGSSDPDGDPLKYTWDFGDGIAKSGGVRETHMYQKGGKYEVMVTVDDGRGSSCSEPCSKDSKVIQVIVNTPPVADAGPNLVCCVGTENAFDGSFSSDSDGDNLTYAWDFGDGVKGEGAKVKHVYNKSGSYTVTLKVSDGTAISTDTLSVKVNESPVSVIKVK
ncbi:MAG: PKD domain-containing protein [Candidatus Omnitrophota bacterium]|nr:PKD domain-containing protein [Candidatus Omnitrophota bacterium]